MEIDHRLVQGFLVILELLLEPLHLRPHLRHLRHRDLGSPVIGCSRMRTIATRPMIARPQSRDRYGSPTSGHEALNATSGAQCRYSAHSPADDLSAGRSDAATRLVIGGFENGTITRDRLGLGPEVDASSARCDCAVGDRASGRWSRTRRRRCDRPSARLCRCSPPCATMPGRCSWCSWVDDPFTCFSSGRTMAGEVIKAMPADRADGPWRPWSDPPRRHSYPA